MPGAICMTPLRALRALWHEGSFDAGEALDPRLREERTLEGTHHDLRLPRSDAHAALYQKAGPILTT
jgi:hypothetical protein